MKAVTLKTILIITILSLCVTVIYFYGYKPILVIITLGYIVLMSFEATRDIGSNALAKIFDLPFAVAGIVAKGTSSVLGGKIKIFNSEIKNSTNDK